jgi:hypothetical protein
VLLAGHFLQRDHLEAFMRSFPWLRPDHHRVTSSFYIQRRESG